VRRPREFAQNPFNFFNHIPHYCSNTTIALAAMVAAWLPAAKTAYVLMAS
jgi:hypothetical protein